MTSPSIIKTVIRFYYITSLVRLANGGASYGRVEIYYSGAWGTVCDDLWDINNANVVCRELGFSRATSAPHGARYGGGTGNIWLDDVESSGGKVSLFNCAHAGWGPGDSGYGHHGNAGVVCA